MIDDLKKRALHRTRILEGQMRGLEKMIESEQYCMDIITQSLAIQKSLRSLNKLLVENHLRTHVVDMFAAGGAQQATAVDELLRVYEWMPDVPRTLGSWSRNCVASSLRTPGTPLAFPGDAQQMPSSRDSSRPSSATNTLPIWSYARSCSAQ